MVGTESAMNPTAGRLVEIPQTYLPFRVFSTENICSDRHRTGARLRIPYFSPKADGIRHKLPTNWGKIGMFSLDTRALLLYT